MKSRPQIKPERKKCCERALLEKKNIINIKRTIET